MSVQFVNKAASRLASDLPAGQIFFELQDASDFPTASGDGFFWVVIQAPGGDPFEVCRVYARDGNTLFAERGQDNTPDLAWDSGSVVAHRVTASTLEDLREPPLNRLSDVSVDTVSSDDLLGFDHATQSWKDQRWPILWTTQGEPPRAKENDIWWRDVNQVDPNIPKGTYSPYIFSNRASPVNQLEWIPYVTYIPGAGYWYLGAVDYFPAFVPEIGGSLVPGMLFYNTAEDLLYLWDGTTWRTIDSYAPGAYQTLRYTVPQGSPQSVFSGPDDDGVTLAFQSLNSLIRVLVGGVLTYQGVDYTVDRNTNTITLAQPVEDTVVYIEQLYSMEDARTRPGVNIWQLNDIQSQFNGTQTVFTLTRIHPSDTSVIAVSTTQISVWLDGIIQRAGTDYNIANGDQITFVKAPEADQEFYGLQYESAEQVPMEFAFVGFSREPPTKEYTILSRSTFNFNVLSLHGKVTFGTATVTVEIDGVPVPGLTNLLFDTTPRLFNVGAATVVAVGQRVTANVTNVTGPPTDLEFTLGCAR